jgi:hypothetical protein
MSPTSLDAPRHDAELAQLRAALRAVQPPPPDEQALRAAFRAKQDERKRIAAAGGSHWRVHLAAAAAVVASVAAVVSVVTFGVERPAPAPALVLEPPAASSAVAAFQPLLNSPGLSPSGSYSVVRVRIPLSSLALVPGTEQSGSIEADLLVGEDGLARGIRFNPADVAYASADAR